MPRKYCFTDWSVAVELNPEEGNDLADDASDDDIVNPAVNVVHAQSIGSTEETAWKL